MGYGSANNTGQNANSTGAVQSVEYLRDFLSLSTRPISLLILFIFEEKPVLKEGAFFRPLVAFTPSMSFHMQLAKTIYLFF